MKNAEYEILTVTGKGPCVIYVTGAGPAEDSQVLYQKILKKTGRQHLVLCMLRVNNWDDLLTPWPADGGPNGRAFGGHSMELLQEIREELIPKIRQEAAIDNCYIAGYSLAGLFALWALYEAKEFDGAVCGSGSVWYPGWETYRDSHKMTHPVKVYLSLGKKEEKTRHPLMCTIGDRMRKQYEVLSEDPQVVRTELVWHDGGHFNDPEGRMLQGIRQILKQV